MTNDDRPKLVSHEQVAETFAIPTINVNRFLVTAHPDRFRIAFGESFTPEHPTFHRLAVQMTPWEANELRMVLEELLVPFQAQIKEMKAANDGSDGE
mgnify:CR=1 FL=1|tara:strand:- start:893 stop:1183 length:291 start_codon:yes stop_codon:yes gene_type:complete